MQPQPAYLLHKRAYRETSALVDVLTLEHGHIRAVAQGVQRAGSKSRAKLQPFAPLHLTWIGEGDLKRLRMMETTQSAVLLAGEGLLCGLYANELLTRSLPVGLPVGEVFAIYAWTLERLTRPAERATALRRLEITLLETLDAEPVLPTSTSARWTPPHAIPTARRAGVFRRWRRMRRAGTGARSSCLPVATGMPRGWPVSARR